MSSSSLASEKDDVVTNMRNPMPTSVGVGGDSGNKVNNLNLDNDPNSLHT